MASTPPIDGVDTFIPSREPANNGYGQNGYQGASSDLPGQHTTSGFLPAVELPKMADGDWQTRKVKADAYPITFGHHKAAAGGTIPATTMRRGRK